MSRADQPAFHYSSSLTVREHFAATRNHGGSASRYRGSTPKRPRKVAARICRWSYDLDSDSWDTDCGHKFCLTNDTPLENHFKFCAFCGLKLKEKLPSPAPARKR